MIIVQISDPHISVPDSDFEQLYQTKKRLKTAIESINRLDPKPDAIFLTGDLINCGQMDEYKILKQVLQMADIPTFLGIGNHDNRENFLASFGSEPYLSDDNFIQYSVEKQGLRMLMLDTNIENCPNGLLCAQRLDWLEKTLSEKPDMPTVIFMHHPPFKTGIVAMDRMGLNEAEKFGRVLENHPQVMRIFCGHIHRPIQSMFHGVMAQVCPSTSHRVLLHLSDEERLATTAEPPEMLLHHWDGKQLVTHSAFTDDFPVLWELEGALY
ncbi:phosphodiesterase [Sneathiella aquimaris]|uniref:phosphodiesterase n=1 Tax=Sneathiella aquimaris TaxID=2599305 RepID=UPI00146AD57B|nr:phosphodiesterase [Sneathiella aquimaris]